jgi:hypothetical protein
MQREQILTILIVAVGLGFWIGAARYFFKSRSTALDLVGEVNSKRSYVLRFDLYGLNPFLPYLVWRAHKESFPDGSGARHLLKRYLALYGLFSLGFLVSILAGWWILG